MKAALSLRKDRYKDSCSLAASWTDGAHQHQGVRHVLLIGRQGRFIREIGHHLYAFSNPALDAGKVLLTIH